MSKIKIKILGRRVFRDKEAENLIRKAVSAAYEVFEYPFDASVDITMTDDDGIRDINRDFRGVDKPTDVLSFPLNEFMEGKAPDDAEVDLDPDTDTLPLGDMIISVERARQQGEELGHGFERECAYLTVHSILHLLGYDHMDEGEQKAKMREMEERIMNQIGLERK